MSTPRPNDTRHRLLEAATSLIWESSYGAASVEGICQRAGVNKGSFYHFFPSKSELAVAALASEWEARKPQWDEFFSPLVAPLDRLRRWQGNAGLGWSEDDIDEVARHLNERFYRFPSGPVVVSGLRLR